MRLLTVTILLLVLARSDVADGKNSKRLKTVVSASVKALEDLSGSLGILPGYNYTGQDVAVEILGNLRITITQFLNGLVFMVDGYRQTALRIGFLAARGRVNIKNLGDLVTNSAKDTLETVAQFLIEAGDLLLPVILPLLYDDTPEVTENRVGKTSAVGDARGELLQRLNVVFASVIFPITGRVADFSSLGDLASDVLSEFLKFLAEVDDLLLPILVPLLSGLVNFAPDWQRAASALGNTRGILLRKANAALARAIFPGVTVFVNIRRLGDLVTDVGSDLLKLLGNALIVGMVLSPLKAFY